MTTVIKQEFIKKVWDKIKTSDGHVIDAVVDLAVIYGIDMETAAKIVASNTPLKQLLEQQAIALKMVKPKNPIA